jgi:hypothetical protein
LNRVYLLGLAAGGCRAPKFFYTLEHLVNVLVDRTWVTGLADNLQQVLVRHEEESREAETLVVEELVQVFLDLLKSNVHVLKDVYEVANVRVYQSLVAFLLAVDALHLLLESLVNLDEPAVLLGQELNDISLPEEDALKILPHALHLH